MHQESLFNQNIDEFVGQQHLLRKNKILREIIMND